MINAIKTRVARLFAKSLEKQTSVWSSTAAPTIGNCVSARAETAISPALIGVTGAGTPPPMTPIIAGASPQATMIGIRRGADYAGHFAVEFVACVRRSCMHPVTWMVDDLLTIAKQQFALPNELLVPPDRSLLSALKRLPGIEVRQNVRGFRPGGAKATIYTIRPIQSASADLIGAAGNSQLPSPLAA